MDDAVDVLYKRKHFPQAALPANATKTAGGAAPAQGKPTALKDLIASFASLAIQASPPAIAGDRQEPCYLAELPEEILVHILRDVAVADVGDFVRLAQVCKRLAFLVTTEAQIWKRVALRSFSEMPYHFKREITWEPVDDNGDAEQRAADALAETMTLLRTKYTSWSGMFRLRPRIRFNGCYVNTINYWSGGSSSSSAWNTGTFHLVTYYRYLRFFRSGIVISLVTTTEPRNVVHYLTTELLELHLDGAMAHLPSTFMQSALRGRWRLSSAADHPDGGLSASEAEGHLFIETEGVGKYHYLQNVMHLELQTAGKGTKNNKLAWRGFHS